MGLVRWWRARDDAPAWLVHADLHHDLGRDASPGPFGSGDVVRAAVHEGRAHHVTWVVPFERQRLEGNVAEALVAMLPADARVAQLSDGRARLRLDDVAIDIRGADDLPDGRGHRSPVELSVDLDFLYHPDVAGPTTDPVAFVHRLLAWRRRTRPRATFVATGFAAGYCPPTYTPVAAWLREALRTGILPAGSRQLWRRVLARERARLGGGSIDEDEGVLGAVWTAYLDRRWDDLRATLPDMPPALRFHPREELLVELQAGRRWPDHMQSRVEEAARALGPAWAPREEA